MKDKNFTTSLTPSIQTNLRTLFWQEGNSDRVLALSSNKDKAFIWKMVDLQNGIPKVADSSIIVGKDSSAKGIVCAREHHKSFVFALGNVISASIVTLADVKAGKNNIKGNILHYFFS